jgi:hypothetical protein
MDRLDGLNDRAKVVGLSAKGHSIGRWIKVSEAIIELKAADRTHRPNIRVSKRAGLRRGGLAFQPLVKMLKVVPECPWFKRRILLYVEAGPEFRPALRE